MADMSYIPPTPWHVSTTGHTQPPFEELRDILARVVAAQGLGGAGLAVYMDGEPTVDLVAGDYEENSLQVVFSVSKAIVAIELARLHADGAIDLDAPLAATWPEFRKASTAEITTRMVLAHRSGLPAVNGEFTLKELAAGAEDEAIGRQEPYWRPGTAHGYHSFTFGTLVDGIVRRTTGRGVADHVREDITLPLGAEIGFGVDRGQEFRLQPVLRPRAASTDRVAATAAAATVPAGQIGRLARTMDVYNDPLFQTAGFPAVGAVASARGLARILAATLTPVDGVRLLDNTALRNLTTPRSEGVDRILGIPIRFGSGVQLPFPQLTLLGPGSFGHEGAGGSVAFADPESGIAVGYTTNAFPPLMGAGVGFDTILAAIRFALNHKSS